MRLPPDILRDQAGELLRPPPGFSTMAGAAGGVRRRGASYDYGRTAASYLLAGVVNWYVDSARPNNAGNGLTPATAKRDIWAVLNALPFPDVGPVNVWVKSGTYDLAGGWAGVTVLSRANFIATANLSTATLASWEPGAVTSTASPLTLSWSVETGSTYKANLAAAPYAVVDELQATAIGLGTRLTLRASIALVDANPGSYHHASGVLYVRTADSRLPDTSVHAFKATQINGYSNLAGVSVYVDGFTFKGGSRAFYLQAGTAATFRGCSFRYGELEGLGANACADVRLFDCDADENTADGIAYTTVTRGLEARCRGRRNGFDGTNINNGSTMHLGGSIIRLAGTYTDNQGPNVADVQNTATWMAGCTMSGTRSGDNSRKVNFWSEGLAYLERCTLADNLADVRADASGDIVSLWSTATPNGAIGSGLTRESRG